MPNAFKIAAAQKAVEVEQGWIDSHGKTLQGYKELYGSYTQSEDEGRYGSGGEAIFHADHAALFAAKAHLYALQGRSGLAETMADVAAAHRIQSRHFSQFAGVTV